ncbi:2-oxo-4-hydroxy-4-carboxy-5-ureidoimidazoline decarboxylase [Cohnella zeiphila]|uniref:2-oxo-4-hydroxy-4-carboxy-5-ureidoimidazoline decarboxylase n=1 Tax=Cohnella zeiphila TaxID=2761120 RepID=UPI001EE19C58|nr:2-oxo-4-hydroxy-4-carboxy-5-ureidoimidazoline decarboxylase [Cohnella zeiphila]
MSATIGEINAMDRASFAETLGAVFEHSPWVAEKAWDEAPFRSRDDLYAAMKRQAENASDEEKLALFRAHPDLATRLKVTEYSAGEQRGAGLDRLSPEEFRFFEEMNRSYKAKFGFPFILAVAGKTKERIAEEMERRIANDEAAERLRALAEVLRIAEIRLNRIVIDHS